MFIVIICGERAMTGQSAGVDLLSHWRFEQLLVADSAGVRWHCVNASETQ
jgi:hypothetical protein